jgi:hypothetical protein
MPMLAASVGMPPDASPLAPRPSPLLSRAEFFKIRDRQIEKAG